MKLLHLAAGSLLAALCGAEGELQVAEYLDDGELFYFDHGPTRYNVTCGADPGSGEDLSVSCPVSTKPEADGGDAAAYLGYECTNKRYIPPQLCAEGLCSMNLVDWLALENPGNGECVCAKWECDDNGCEDVVCPTPVVPECEEGMQARYIKPDPAAGRCCGWYEECKWPDPAPTAVVYRTDPWDRVYQWSHYYDEVTGEPTDSRVPPGWKWNKHAKGATDFSCNALWNKVTNMPDLDAIETDPRVMQMNVCGKDSGVCCIRGWEAAVEFCQAFSECTLLDFMDEDPGDYLPTADKMIVDSTNEHFLQMVGLSEFPDGSTYGFYEAITDPIYVLRGDRVERATMVGSNPSKMDEGYARFWNSCESPLKCPDGTLKDCRGRCFGDAKDYTWMTATINDDLAIDAANLSVQAPVSAAAEAAGVWPDGLASKCWLSQVGDWSFWRKSDGTLTVKNKVKRAADVEAAGDGHCALVDDSIWEGDSLLRLDLHAKDYAITKEECERLAGTNAGGSAVDFVLGWIDPPPIPEYTYEDYLDWLNGRSADEALEELEVTVSCSYSPFGNCKVYGLDWGHFPEGDCRALWKDYVCDKGQRILSSGELGPDLNCAKFEFDRGDCDCEEGRTMTCSGYCLSDADCVSTVWGKTSCADWLTDDVCDYGQRISDAQITMHFECQEWKFDNGACCEGGSVEADGSCTVAQNYECPAEPLSETEITQSCPADLSNNDLLVWTPIDKTPAPEPTVHPNYKTRSNVDIYKVSGDVESIKAELEHLAAGLSSGPRYVTDDPALVRNPPDIHNQERVWVSYFHSGYFYEAVIDNHSGPNGIEVTYKDGDRQTDVERDEVFAIEEWDEGSMVWRRSDHGDWDPAKVVQKAAGAEGGIEYTLEMGNGDIVSEWNDWEMVRPEFEFQLGDHVWAERDGNLRWFKGVITNANVQGDGDWAYRVYDVTYTNGETDLNIRAPMIFLIHPKRIIQTSGSMDEEGICQIAQSCGSP